MKNKYRILYEDLRNGMLTQAANSLNAPKNLEDIKEPEMRLNPTLVSMATIIASFVVDKVISWDEEFNTPTLREQKCLEESK